MPGTRRHSRRVGWIALFAILLGLIPPAGAHRHGGTAGIGGHGDFCTAVGTQGPLPAMPSPADKSHGACTHCDGCTGTSGSAWAPPTPIAAAIVVAPAPCAVIVFALPAATPVDRLAAPPRGPPALA
jgi:hypothetical protein